MCCSLEKGIYNLRYVAQNEKGYINTNEFSAKMIKSKETDIVTKCFNHCDPTLIQISNRPVELGIRQEGANKNNSNNLNLKL